MKQKAPSHDYRVVIAFIAVTLFALALLAALIVPGAIPLLPTLVELLRLTLKTLESS